jgi:molybdopterin biosynthesis enzyme MoaB
MRDVIEREAPGISEAARLYGQERTPYSMLSRGKAGVRGRTLIVNLPGSRKGVADSLNALFPGLLHSFKMISGGNHD